MAFSYDPDNPVVRDKLRFTLGDTDPDEYIFEDSELDMALSMEDNAINMAAGIACRAVATNKAKQAIVVKLMDVTIDKKSVSKIYLELADKFETKEVNTVVEYLDSYAFVRDVHGRDGLTEWQDEDEYF